MKEGDVALTPIPQADGKVKSRPVIILRELPPYRDLLVCGVSTQLQQYVKGFDEMVSPADSDFLSSGLIRESVIIPIMASSSAFRKANSVVGAVREPPLPVQI